jgi:hypothetical protein
MNKVVYYHVSGRAHLPYLVVSLKTLREWWSGEVRVYAWPESIDTVKQICLDSRLAATAFEDEKIEGSGKGTHYLPKIRIAQTLREYDASLYIDCDTSINGNLEALFVAGQQAGFAVPQFNDWNTGRGVIKARLERLKQFSPTIPASLVDQLCNSEYPSLNCGVWACHHSSIVLPVWYDWTRTALGVFIPDEMTLHVLQLRFPTLRIVDGRYNASPKYWSRKSEPAIWHYHGNLATKRMGDGDGPAKSEKGMSMWWNLFDKCRKEHVGSINDWLYTCGNSHLERLIDEKDKSHADAH